MNRKMDDAPCSAQNTSKLPTAARARRSAGCIISHIPQEVQAGYEARDVGEEHEEEGGADAHYPMTTFEFPKRTGIRLSGIWKRPSWAIKKVACLSLNRLSGCPSFLLGVRSSTM